MDTTYVGFPITKTEVLSDGTRMVWGPATTDDLDSDRQIIDPTFAAKGLAEWFATGANVREMHQPKAIGKGIELVTEGTKQMLKGHIVTKDACDLVDNDVLRAWSVGINDAKILKGPGHPSGGRIVGGTFVEVSLVDRPANASCKVQVVRKAEQSSDAVFTEATVGCVTCAGTGITKSGLACEDCEEDNVAKIETLEDVGFIGKKKLSSRARNDLDDDDFAIPDQRAYPIHDESHARNALSRVEQNGTDDEKKKVRAAVHRRYPNIGKSEGDAEVTSTPQLDEDDTATVETDTDETDDETNTDREEVLGDAAAAEADTSTETGKSESLAPFSLRRLHDHTCPAFDPEVVKDVYPAITSFSDVLDPDFFAHLLSAAAIETLSDMTKAGDLADLSAAYGDVLSLVGVDESEAEAARRDLHKMFTDAYPSVSLSPRTITPGQFKRPFISSGRASMRPRGTPRIPSQSGNASPPQRGPLRDHQERTLPSSGPAHSMPRGGIRSIKAEDVVVEKSRVVFQGSTIDTFVASYDGVTGVGDTERQARKRLAKKIEREPVETTVDVEKERNFYTHRARDQYAAAMEQLHDFIAGSHPDLCPMGGPRHADETGGGPTVLDNRQDSSPMGGRSLSVSFGEGDTTKAIRKLQKAQKRQEEELEALRAENAELAKMADPERAPLRGARGALSSMPSTAKAVAQVDPAETERAREIEWLQRTIKAGDPEERGGAIDKLRQIYDGDPDGFAKSLLTA